MRNHAKEEMRVKRKMKKRLEAWLLVIIMVLNLFAIPVKEVKAADTVTYDLLKGTLLTETGTVAKDPYGEDYFCEHQFGNLDSTLLSSLGSYEKLVFRAEVTVNSASSGMPTLVAYAMDANYGNWKDVGEVMSSLPETKTIELDLTSYTSLSRVGLRLTQCPDGATINYTIKSAQIIGTKATADDGTGDESGDGTQNGNSDGTQEGGTVENSDAVTATVTQLSGNADWAEYSYTVTNGTESAISGIKIKVPFSGAVNNLQSWGCKATQSNGYVVISHTAVLEAGATYTCDSNTKFGFSGGATFGTPMVEFVYGEDGGGTSSSALKYELTGKTKDVAYADTPVGKHGKLSLREVEGYSAPMIVDASGKPFQLRGASTHGMHWNEMHPYVNKGSFQSLRDEWGINLVRLVSYVTQGGYTHGAQALLDQKIEEGVAAATELGMYVIIDWHIHAENPLDTQANAEAFFEKYATKYKDYDNVIFEICNEPTGVNWYNGDSGEDLYTYCKDIANIIRKCGSDALIICGTNTWSQDVDDVAKKPLKDDKFENILYTFHFYSGSHYSDKMQKVKTALAAGTPIFVTEFGICDASGNGNFDTANADEWIKLCDENNLSFCCWSLCNKNESASYLKPSCTKTNGGWLESDLATTGIWLVNTCRAHEEAELGSEGTGNAPDGGEDEGTGNIPESGENEESGADSDDNIFKTILEEILFPSCSKTIEAGTKLSDVPLNFTSDAYGVFAWEMPEKVLTTEDTQANVVYTLADTENVEIDANVVGVNTEKTAVTRAVTLTVVNTNEENSNEESDPCPEDGEVPGTGEGTETPPGEGEGTETIPGENEGTETPPGEGEGTETIPGENDGTETTPGEGEGTESTPGEDEGTGTTPGGEEGTETTPGEGDETESIPGEDDGTGTTPGEGEGIESTPGEDEGNGTTPGGEEGTETTPGEGDGTESTPGEDEGTGTTPGEGEGTETTPEEGKGTESKPGASEGNGTTSGNSGTVSVPDGESSVAQEAEILATDLILTTSVKNVPAMSVNKTIKLAPKKKMFINVRFLPENAKKEELTFTSSEPKVVNVDENGVITAGKKAGKATITVTSANGLKKSFIVQVTKKAVKKISLKTSAKAIKVKKKLQIKATILPSKKYANTKLYWKSSNTKVATVTQSGVVKGVKKGKAKITAYATDGSGKKAWITIRVK